MVPIAGRARSSSYFLSFQKQNREEGVTERKQQAYQLTSRAEYLMIAWNKVCLISRAAMYLMICGQYEMKVCCHKKLSSIPSYLQLGETQS